MSIWIGTVVVVRAKSRMAWVAKFSKRIVQIVLIDVEFIGIRSHEICVGVELPKRIMEIVWCHSVVRIRAWELDTGIMKVGVVGVVEATGVELPE